MPPTSGLVAVMFGPRYMGTLFGVVFLSRQIGALLGLFAALIHLTIGKVPARSVLLAFSG